MTLTQFVVLSLATPTPNGGYAIPKSVTEEQMMYAKGFEEALEHLKNADSSTTGRLRLKNKVVARVLCFEKNEDPLFKDSKNIGNDNTFKNY